MPKKVEARLLAAQHVAEHVPGVGRRTELLVVHPHVNLVRRGDVRLLAHVSNDVADAVAWIEPAAGATVRAERLSRPPERGYVLLIFRRHERIFQRRVNSVTSLFEERRVNRLHILPVMYVERERRA